MSFYKIGDLVRYALSDVKDEFGVMPAYEVIGLVINETRVVDITSENQQWSYLTILWSDGSLSHAPAHQDGSLVLELLTITK
jgi:hypothetical protein